MTSLPSQVGFYLLPPEDSNNNKKKLNNSNSNSNNNNNNVHSLPYPGVSRHWKSQNHLDAISEVSEEEAATSTPKSGSLEPKLLRYEHYNAYRGVVGSVREKNLGYFLCQNLNLDECYKIYTQ